MNAELIGGQIAKYRKAAGLTQELLKELFLSCFPYQFPDHALPP